MNFENFNNQAPTESESSGTNQKKETIEIGGSNSLDWWHRRQVYDMYLENYADNPLLADYLSTMLFEEEEPEDTIFVTTKEKEEGKIIGFLRLIPITDEKMKLSSFNVKKDKQNLGIGKAMYEVVDRYANFQILIADTDPLKKIASYYVEKGFVMTKRESIQNTESVEIICNRTLKDEILKSKGWGKEYIIKKYEETQFEDFKDIFCVKVKSDELSLKNFDKIGVEEKTGDSWVVTQYFFDPSQEFVYIVYEKISAEDLDRFENSNESDRAETLIE